MKNILGIDLGTSSVKLLLRFGDGQVRKAREPYREHTPSGWIEALVRAAAQLDLSKVDAVGLSSQVGTYVVNDDTVLEWSAPVGLSELREIKEQFPQETFIREITMPHPDIISYPLPRLLHITREFKELRSVCMPKEILIGFLTGNRVSDPYSWRGLANLETYSYSRFFLDWLGVEEDVLPPLRQPHECAGHVTAQAACRMGLREGVPVYTGCNDFFAALAATGIGQPGDLFDITGTSEHLGGIADSMLRDAPPVSGRYFEHYVRYGVTGSSGASLDYALRLHDGPVDAAKCAARKAPLFLPYVNGERCPVCDPDAKGVFFGIGAGCTPEMMAYAVMEGVTFNLKQILELLGIEGKRMIVTGGASGNAMLNQLKADVLGMQVVTLEEAEASALGAVMLAGVGAGEFGSLAQAAEACVAPTGSFEPQNRIDYSARYQMFKQLYPALKDEFTQWREIQP